MGVPTTGPWKWTFLALLLVSAPILKADPTQSECTSDEECLSRNLERAKRSSDLQVEVNGDQTTTYYLKTDSVGRPRPLGLITSTEGAFVNDGTTTQYTTQILGMSLHGTYAKIISTSQRVFSPIPVKTNVPEYHPTGMVSSVVDTTVIDGTTTLQTTELYRTFIGNLYAQEIVSRSEVIKPTSIVAEAEIHATATVQSSIVTEIPSEHSTSGSIVFQKSYLTQIVGQRLTPSISIQREEDWATEDSNKLLESFTEDNLLRARKADTEGAIIVDNIQPNKPAIALATFRAGRRLDEIFADEDAQKSTTSSPPSTTTTEKQQEVVVRTEQRIESHEVKGDSVVVKVVHQDVPVIPSPALLPTAVPEDPTKPTTVTYEGFAAFTTQVGNTHIVFKPSTGLSPSSALPRPSVKSSTVVLDTSETIVSSHVTVDSVVSVEVSSEAPVVVITSQVSSSESMVGKEEKEPVTTPEPAILQEAEAPLRLNALMSNKPLEVMATALEESHESARKARISVGDNPWVVFATNSVVEVEAPTARQIGTDSSTLVTDIKPAQESVKESLAESSTPTPVLVSETSTPTPVIAMATEQAETPVTLSPMKSESISVFSAVTEENIPAPEVENTKEEVVLTMSSEEPETETEAATEPNPMPAVIMPSMIEPEEMTMSGTAFITYTYFTTFFDDRTTKVITREEVVANVLKTGSSDDAAFTADPEHQARGIFSSVDGGMMKTFFTTYTYFTTLSVDDQTVVSSRTEVYSNVLMASGQAMDDSVMAEFGLVAENESLPVERSSSSTPSTTVLPSTVRQLETSVWAGKVMEPHTESDESMNHPVAQAAPALLAVPNSLPLESSMTQVEPVVKTLFTTFTYFTTFFNEGTSTVTSKEETVTNVLTEGGETTALTATEAIFPVTYYTTFTYWTTSTNDGQVVVTSREETQSRVVIPTETEASGAVPTGTTEEPVMSSTVVPNLTTFYTTFTYFTTSFDGETPVVSSSFETVTNVVNSLSAAVEQSSARAVGEVAPSNAIQEPIGFLSSLTTVEVNNGITTSFSTDVVGTFINGLYATILESTSSVVAVESSPRVVAPQTTSRFPVGLVSVNMGTAYDIDDPTTTYFTSKAFGTYIGDLYAQVIESTTSLGIDEAKSVTVALDEFRTGLVRSIEGSIVKDSVTTVYASQIVGTIIDGLYAQVIQSTSTFIEATPVAVIAETSTAAAPAPEAPVIDNSALPQPATTPLTLEGSISAEVMTPSAEENDATPTGESKLLGGKLKFPSRLSPASRSRPAFSPSFRPVNTQRPRPGLPIKKAKPSSSSASIEPSPVSASSFSATRVASSRFTSSSVRSSATATPSSNRLFRLTRPSSSGFAASSASSFGSTLSPRRSSSFVNPSAAGSSNFRRSSASSEALGPSRVRSSSGLPLASSRSSSGVAGLTRLHQRGSSSAAPKIQPTPVVEENVASIETPVEETLHEDLQDIAEEPQQEVTAPPKQPGRLPLRPVTPRPAPSTTANSRRQFPFRRPQLPTTSAPASTAESDNGIIGGPTTSKPRFVRPPRITVTARPRPTLSPLSSRFVKRPSQFDDTQEDIDTQSSNLSPLRRRSKREDPFFTRQQRGTVRRRQVFEQGRRASPSRSTPTRTRAASWEEPVAVDYLDYDASEEAPATSKPRFSSSSRQTTSSFRNRAAATTQAPPVRSRPSRPRLSPTGARQSEFTLTNRQPTTSQRFRKPETSNTRSSFRRPETTTSSRTRTRLNSQTVTTEEPRSSTGRRFNSNSRRPSSSSTRVRDNEFEEVPPTRQREGADAAPALITPLTVTHRVPSETTIPIVKNGATEYRTVITAMPSLQVLPTYSSTKIAGTWRYLASELSSIKGPGMTEVTQYFIKPSETNIVEFTPTTIRGRHTSFSHLIPSTVYEVETSVTTIQDPVAATNNLLQQLLLGNLGANPLLGVPGAPATPVTQFTTHTSTYVTTLTDLLSTILPITLRGKEVRTTIVHSTTSVVTLTEMSTETNIITPAIQQFAPQANPFASLLPVLLQNQLLQGQLGLQPTPALQAQPIQPTIAPQTHEDEKIIDSPRKSTRQQQKFQPEEEEDDHHDEIIQPARPQPVTSVVTLYLSGRRPGEFSSVLSTVTLDGSEASVVKRHSPQTASPIEASALPFAIGTDKGLFELPDGYTEEDLEYYLVSAMNEIGAEEIYDTAEAQHLQYVLTHAQPTPELNGDYGKKLQGKNRKARQALDSNEDDSELLSSLVEDDWARVVPASQPQPLVKEVHELPEPAAPSKVRKTKTVIVTRKVRPTAGVPEITPSEVLLEELGITNTLRRKVVVVSRRVKNSKSAVDPLIEPTFAFQEVSGNDLISAVVQESASFEPVSAPSSVTTSATREGRRLVTVTRKRPVSASDLPDLQASTSTPAQEAPATTPKSAPQLDGSLGDVYAPRTYYTIYSYLYTVLNTGVDKPVSSRLVTVSEIVRGKDGRLPSTFFRTENNNGLYTLATGNGNSDLGTRVSQGETLHVNLASAILVKYGRGAIRAHPSADLKPLDSSSATQKSSRVRPTPVEPSFTSHVEENNRDSSSVATQSLPSRIRTTITRTIARTQARPSATTTAKQSEKASTSTTRATSPQRQRGTVRFGGSSGSITRSVAVPQVAATTSRTFIRRPTFSSSRTIVTPVSQFTQPSKGVSNSLEDDYQEPEFDHDYQDNPEHFDEYHEYDEDLPHDEGREDFVEDVPQYDEEYPEHEDDYIVDDERLNESEAPIHDDAGLGVSPASSSTRSVASSIIVSSSRSRVNPLEKHLSSIRAAARSSSGVTSSSVLPFRSRLAQRLSASSSFSGPIEPSHVYYHTFATTSTLLVDGGRDPVLVTLMTSTLTTIADSQLSIVTESPQAFSPVTSTSSSPLLRSSSRLSLFSTRVASSRNSPASSATSTVVPTLSTLTTVLTPSTEAVEASFVTTEDSLEESTEPITTPMPESVETTPLSVGGEEEMKQESEAVVPARANPATTTVISTVLETELRTFTAVVTRKSNDEEIVTTHFETVPEVITKTITVVQTLDAPTARFVGNAGASAQIIDPSPKAGLRGGRLSIDANARLPLATKVMSNGVEVIVAGERKNTLLAHEVVQGTQVLDASSPFTLPPTAISNAMLVDSEVLNQGLLSSIQSATAEFITQTYLTTFTYLTTLLEDDLPVVSSRHEIISNVVTREPGHFLTTPVPDLTLTSGFVSPSYSTYTYLTTYTYYNTFLDSSRPVVLKSKETVSNIVTIPADSANKMIQSSALFDTQTYLRTYTFFKTLSDSVHTTEEVITQVVVTEAPIQTQVPVQPTPTVSSELTKTYLTTVTYLTTEVEGTDTVIRQDTVVSSEVVTETIFSEVEATPTLPLPVVSAQPNLEASLPLLPVAEDSDGPIFATKTYFTTSTYYTTMLEDESTVVKSRTEITSSVATERLPQGLGALFMSTDSVFVPPSDSRTTYLSFGDNVYGQLRTILATATYYITDAQGSVATKQLVIPQISTSTITTSALPSDAVIQPSSSILSSGSLASIKASFLASSSASPSSILSADQLQSIKSSFLLSSTPTFGPEEADSADINTSELSTDDGNTLPAEPTVGGAVLAATPELNLPFPPPQVGTAVVTSPTTVTGLDGSVSSVSSGATVVMVTDAAGGVAVLPTEVLTSGATVVGTIVNQKPSLWNLGTLGTVGLAALSQGLAGNTLGGLNINLGPVIDSMTGLISNAFLTRRNDSIARTQSRVPAEIPVQQQDPIFIPVGSIGASQNDREDVVARQPTFIPLRRLEPAPQQPAPAVPLQPQPGSPLFRPGTDPRPLVRFPGQPADGARPGGFRSPGIETGFSAIQPTTRATVITGAETVFLGRPNLALARPNGVNFEQHQQGPINPSRPIISHGATTHFFDPNGQPFPDRSPVRFPSPLTPPNQPILGNLVPGPDGKPVRIVAVPEGINPPPGASGQVFVRPAAPAVQPGLEPAPAIRPVQQTPALPTVRPGSAPIRPLPMVEFDQPRPVSPSVQTIVSIEGDNKIVGTRIVSQGQTVLIQPTQPVPRPVEALPTIAVIPSSVAVAVPSVVTEEPKVPLTSGTVEVFTHPAEPSSESPPLEILALPDVPIVPEISVVSEVPAEEVAVSVALAQPEVPSSSVQLLPSFASEITTTTTTSSNVFPNIASWTTPTPTVTRMHEPDGITKVILGANNQLTTFVTRVETSATHAHTLLSTIVDGHTQVNAVQPTAVMEQSTEGTQVIQESSFSVAKTVSVSQSNEKSPPPPTMDEKSTTMTTTTTTQPPIRLGGIFIFGNNEPAGTSATTTTTTTTEESIADKVLDESINNVLLSGPQRTQVSVNHKPVEVAKCNPQCKDFEICQSRGPAPPTCVCRPGYARSDATQPCTKAFTYQVRLAVENVKQPSRSNFTWMADPSAPEYHQMTHVLRTGIQDTLERAELWNAYRNADVMAVKPMEGSAHKHALAEFVVQLGSQYDEQQLKSSLQKALEINQYRLSEDVMVAARVSDGLVVQDFDECSGGTHDCPESSVCVNNHGSYECQCKPGMQDAIDGSGRLCIGASQELGDCDLCSRQGRCETSPAGENVCICNFWFTGDKCQFNLKVLMIALVSLGVLLILLMFGCIIVCCIRNRRASSTISPVAPAFLRYRGGMMPPTGTMDRTAMIRGDTSSESSVGLGVSGIDNMAGTLEGRGKGNAGASLQSYRHYGEGDDKVPVIIPRVRTHREQPPVHNEQQMLSFLEQGRTGQGRLRASTDNLASVGARSSSTLTTLRGPESSDGPNHTSTPNLTNANPPDDVDSTMNEARSYDETTVRPAVRHLHSSTGSVNRTQSHGGKQYFQHEDARSPGVRGQGRPSLRLAFPRPSLYTSFRDSEGSNFDSL